jgi:hypothetical protein
MTPLRKEYLYQLSDMSGASHTAEYLATAINKVIESIGVNRISALVSDNASNVQNARAIIHNKYPNIENVRCIAHAINLIACDIVKENFGDRLLRRVNNLATYFKKSHQAGAKLTQLIKENEISGGGIKLYCKTRWTTASESVESLIRLEPILEKISSEYDYLLSDKAKHIIQGRNFFSNLRILAFVLDPLRKAVLVLESRSATLGDCFLNLAQLAAVLKKLPRSFNQTFRNHCFKVMNERFEEFDDDKYLTCFFLDPRFRDSLIKKGAYTKVVKCAMTIGKRLGFDFLETKILCEQLRKYKDHEEPFDLDIACCLEDARSWWELIDTNPQPDTLPTVARHLLSICPNSASCERGFSTLGWLFNKRRLNLNLQRLESMCKMIMYWKSNAKTELGFYGLNQQKNTRLSDTEINRRISEAFAETDDEDDECEGESESETSALQIVSNETIPKDNCIVLIESVWIEKFVDLSHNLITEGIGNIPNDILDNSDNSDINDYEIDINENNEDGKGVLDYNIDDLLEEFVSEE